MKDGRRALAAVVVVAVLATTAFLLRRRGSPAPAPVPAPPTAAPAAAPANPPSTAPPPISEPPKAAAVPAEAGFVLAGRIVDERRRPAAGASVELRRPDAPPGTATTGPDGRFEIRGVPRPGALFVNAGLLARDGAGRAAAKPWTIPRESAGRADHLDAGILVLRPASALPVVVQDGGKPAAGARVRLGAEAEYGMGTGWIAETSTGEDGRARFEGIPGGGYALLARSPGGRIGRASAAVPLAGDGPVAILLDVDTRTVEVQVVEGGTGAPVAGAAVDVWLVVKSPGMVSIGPYPDPLAVPPTDAEGRTRIPGTAMDEELLLKVDAKGWFPPGRGGLEYSRGQRVPAGATEVRLELPAARIVSWPVADGEVPAPPDGSAVRLVRDRGSANAPVAEEGRMEGRSLVVHGHGDGPSHARAVAPDGSLAYLFIGKGESVGREISFRRPRAVEVVLREEDGRPAPGLVVAVRDGGNNDLADPVRTGADGRARFEGLHGAAADVFLTAGVGMGIRIGSVNLAAGDGRVEAVLPGLRTVLLRVTLDGEPGLPGDLSVTCGMAGAAETEEDPVAGEVRFRTRPGAKGGAVGFSVRARGYVPVEGRAETAGSGDPVVVPVALRTAGALLATIRPPADGQYRPEIQVEGDDGRWGPARTAGGPPRRAAPSIRFEPLDRGRYRVRDGWTGIASEAVEVVPGAAVPEVRLDLSGSGFAKGRVEVPEGTAFTDVRVVVAGEGLDASGVFPQPQPGQSVFRDGTFQVRVPGDRPVALRPWHPSLVPAPGTVTVTDPREGLVLRLVGGARAVFALDPTPERTGHEAPIRILLFRGEAHGAPAAEFPCAVVDRSVSFGGFEPGTWTVWIDVPGFAPAVLRDAALGGGRTDLGVVRLSAGSSLRVRVEVPDGQSPPRLDLGAEALDPPAYRRWAWSRGEAEAVLPGLGPGRFRVTARPGMGGGKSLDVEIELDGASDRVLTLDLR